MGKYQQTMWLAGLTGLSAACVTSFLLSTGSTEPVSSEPPQPAHPHALLAANTDRDQTVTLAEVRQMLDGHFTKLDADKDGLIDRDEYAGRHIHLFTAIDTDHNQMLTPAELRQHRQNSALLHKTAYQ